MLHLLSWNSGLAADKITQQDINYLAQQRRRSPTIDCQKPSMLKRKRVDSAEVDMPNSPNRRRMESIPRFPVDTNSMPTKVLLSASALGAADTPVCPIPRQPMLEQGGMDKADSTPDEPASIRMKPEKEILRRALNSQISLEILLKHDELRLIDQEMAKCQIALEQLRRCMEIPYPITGLSPSLSQGLGPAVRSSRSSASPESPAPWGVADGPYTRHYAKWLLPDPLFDGGVLPQSAGLKSPAGKTPTKGRSTRGSFADAGVATGQSKAQRAGKFQALSNGYLQPKDKPGPMMQKRKSDGVLVKLVCLDCRRDNFSSAQGFINHCRIAHGRNFSSHDAAAEACGEPVDLDATGAVVGIDGPPSASMAGLVHPLIYSALLLKSQLTASALDDPSAAERSRPVPVASAAEPRTMESFRPFSTSQLIPSALIPNLSTLMQRQGTKLDLQSLVSDMKTSILVDESSESEGVEGEDEDSSMLEAPALRRHPHPTASMQPARFTTLEERDAPSGGGKGLRHPRTLTTAASQSLLPAAQAPARRMMTSAYLPTAHSDVLERSPTNESNQAPSLVDDDGDDEYEAHSPSYSAAGSVDNEARELDFEVEDGDEGGASARNRSTDSEYSGTPKQAAPPASTRRASAFRRSISGREEKHVSFVSPSPAREGGPRKKAGDGKRRRSESDL